MTDLQQNPPQQGDGAQKPAAEQPQVHVHNSISIGGNRGWNILITLLAVAGLVVIAWQLSLGPWKEVVSTGLSMFLVTLVSLMFKAGILRLPEREDDDLAFTKSTLRRIYDEVQAAIAKSSIVRLAFFAAAQTAGFLLLRAGIGLGLAAISSVWMAVGVGLLAGAAVVAQDQILAWVRTLQTKKGYRS